jgi:hypothetical protein
MRHLLSSPARVGRAAAASVSFAVAVLGLVFLLWPSLKPEPPAAVKPEPPPAVKEAHLSDITVDRHVTFAAYLDRGAYSRMSITRADLRRTGVLIGFAFTIQGYEGRRLPLRWQLIDARTGEQVSQRQDLFIVPEAAADRSTFPIWVRPPSGRRRVFFVEVELRDDRSPAPLDRLRTRRFRWP